jgi:hypothetical protein
MMGLLTTILWNIATVIGFLLALGMLIEWVSFSIAKHIMTMARYELANHIKLNITQEGLILDPNKGNVPDKNLEHAYKRKR